MPRLPLLEYLQHYRRLRQEWLCDAYAYVVLTPAEQIAIHDFYEPSLELTDAQLRELRKRVTKADPSLPHRAGKAYARFAPFIGDDHPPMLGGTSMVRAGKRTGELRRTTVWGEVQPHIDPEQLAKILLDAAMEQWRRERDESEDRDAA